MDLLLPAGLKSIIRDRYLAGVSDAVSKFDMHSADEDALTGALGNNLAMPAPMVFGDGSKTYEYQVSYRKIRGRGPGAPEKTLGADGIFQIQVSDDQGTRRKGLPFQSKKGWSGLDRQLAQQSTLMVNTASDGLVIDYRSSGYTGFDARDVIHAGGNRKLVGSRSGKPLGQLLANEFLDCKIGVPDLFFDPEKENWNILRFIGDEQPFHVISTTVKQTPIPDRS
jgi:hypothetical protein